MATNEHASTPRPSGLADALRVSDIQDKGNALILHFEDAFSGSPIDPVLEGRAAHAQNLASLERGLAAYATTLRLAARDKSAVVIVPHTSDVDDAPQDPVELPKEAYLPPAFQGVPSRNDLGQMKNSVRKSFPFKLGDSTWLTIASRQSRGGVADKIDNYIKKLTAYRTAITQLYVADRVDAIQARLRQPKGELPKNTMNFSMSLEHLDVTRQTGWAAEYALSKGRGVLAEYLFGLAKKYYGDAIMRSSLGLSLETVSFLQRRMALRQARVRLQLIDRWQDNAPRMFFDAARGSGYEQAYRYTEEALEMAEEATKLDDPLIQKEAQELAHALRLRHFVARVVYGVHSTKVGMREATIPQTEKERRAVIQKQRMTAIRGVREAIKFAAEVENPSDTFIHGRSVTVYEYRAKEVEKMLWGQIVESF